MIEKLYKKLSELPYVYVAKNVKFSCKGNESSFILIAFNTKNNTINVFYAEDDKRTIVNDIKTFYCLDKFRKINVYIPENFKSYKILYSLKYPYLRDYENNLQLNISKNLESILNSLLK